MSKYSGTISRGIKLPILKIGDDLAGEIVKAVTKASKKDHFKLQDKDVIAITESIVSRTDGNYVSVSDIAADVAEKVGGDNKVIGVVFPILSRNRFSVILRGIAKAAKKIVLVLSFPADEVGNHLISDMDLYKHGVSMDESMTETKFREIFGETKHEFTGIDYIQYYKDLIHECDCDAEIIMSNDPTVVLKRTKTVIAADIHTRFMTKAKLEAAGAKKVILLSDILSTSSDTHGYNSKYGLLGSNKVDDSILKLFPESGDELVHKVQDMIFKKTKKRVEVMVYGDGAFKDPQGKIWELADPVVSPFYTEGLKGTPNEIKLKYFADNKFRELTGKELDKAIKEEIAKKGGDLKGNMASEGTTPRQLTDLLGSLADLTSGSGDKGTPVVLIQGYFNNYSSK